MTIGFVGLGKLGLPCALAVEAFGGHRVFGCETSASVRRSIQNRQMPYKEVSAQELLEATRIEIVEPGELLERCDLIFFAIQTPHDPRFEGITPLPVERADFDYTHLKEAVSTFAGLAKLQRRTVNLVVISTVLPGTMHRVIVPLLNEWTRLCYNPFFIAMGTTIPDFMDPEFILLGCDDDDLRETMCRFYSTLHQAPVIPMSVRSAELTKVAYNTFIGMKIVFANTMMEICEATGANVDEVTGALGAANKRLISPKYLTAGMGDGGGCHPRDNIAMSWLAREIGLSYDFFEGLMLARERQTRWLAERAQQCAECHSLPVVILGKAFKPETNIATGSPAVLLANLLNELGVTPATYDPFVDPPRDCFDTPAIYIVGTRHACFADILFPAGSVVIDPWGFIPLSSEYDVQRLGRSQTEASRRLKLQSPVGVQGAGA